MSNPLWSRSGAASVGIAIVLWVVLLVLIINVGEMTSIWWH